MDGPKASTNLEGYSQNWVRQALCTDFAHPPEIVPLEAVKNDIELPGFSQFIEVFWEEKGWRRLLLILASLPILLLGWIPSMLYRVSFKATAIAYSPFMWVAHATLGSLLSLKTRLERITKGEFEKVRRGLSWIILTTILIKSAFVLGWVESSYLESKFPSKRFIDSFVVLDGWPWWQLTLGMDAVLTFILLFFADAALARLDGEKVWQEGTILKTVSTLSFLRAALGIITISHFFYVALQAAAPRFAAFLI